MREGHIFSRSTERGKLPFSLNRRTKLISSMSVERDIRYELIARLCPNATGAELKSVATEVSYQSLDIAAKLMKQAGMFAIRSRRKVATERDFLDAVEKVIRQGTKFSSTALYAQYN
jgi:26S proteasome regulatory subunit T1